MSAQLGHIHLHGKLEGNENNTHKSVNSKIMICVQVFFILRVTHTAVQICRAGVAEESHAEEGVWGEITNKETTFSFAPAPPGWLSARFLQRGLAHPCSSPPFLLSQTHIRTNSPTLRRVRRGEEEEREEVGELGDGRQKDEDNFSNNSKEDVEELLKMSNVSVLQTDHLGARGKWFFFPFKRKQEGGRAFFPPYETSEISLCQRSRRLRAGACDLMSLGLSGGQWRMPGCPLWSPICLSSGWASTGWRGARSAPPHGSASRWSSLLSSASGSAWRASVRIPVSKATTPRWSQRTARGPTRW